MLRTITSSTNLPVQLGFLRLPSIHITASLKETLIPILVHLLLLPILMGLQEDLDLEMDLAEEEQVSRAMLQ